MGNPNWLITENNSQDPDPSILQSAVVKHRVKNILKNSEKHIRDIFFIVSIIIIIPITVHAFSLFFNKTSLNKSDIAYLPQTLPLLSTYMPMDIKNAQGGGDINILNGTSLIADIGSLGVGIDIEKPNNDTISLYIVRRGDTLSSIAKLFDVSISTIRGFNDIRDDKDLRSGQELLILPIDGIVHIVKSGETLSSIAKKYAGNEFDISVFNNLEGEKLVAGTEIIIPNAEISNTNSSTKKNSITTKKITIHKGGKSYFKRYWGGTRSQNYHGRFRARDYAMHINSPIGASAGGIVISAKYSGWNGGYGTMIIIKHNNGAQTLYAHLNKVIVSVGQHVSQGEIIAYSGNTGHSTGPHLHFEIRGWGDIPF